MKKIVLAFLSAAAFAGSAAAADMAVKAPIYKAPPPPPVIAYNWTGFYVGINGGGGYGNTTGDLLPVFFDGNFSNSGGMIGGQVGYNYQFNSLVLGVEADWDWANFHGTTPNTPNSSVIDPLTVHDLGTVRGRVGFAWDRALLYATGGWAWTSNMTMFCGGCSNNQTDSHALHGYALGAGIEYSVIQNISLKAEYIYAHLDPANYFVPAGCPGPCTLGENVNTFRLGANLHFGGL